MAMQKRRLGRTGLDVSVVGFGGIPIIALSRSQAEIVVGYAYEKGINYFDTARGYGDSDVISPSIYQLLLVSFYVVAAV
jgi:aryl-alcohol dehydrogenase-like predicted oxidoreductase